MAYTREQLIQLIRQAAAQIGFDANVAIEQLRRESANFRDDVVYGPFVGGAGERGMSQFTPGTWARFGSGPHTNAYNPEASLAAWRAYTSYLVRLFGGDYTKVLQGYNGGEGNVQRGTVSSAAQRYAREILAKAGQTQAPIPIPQPSDPAWADYCDPDGFCYGASWEQPQSETGWSLTTWLAIGGGVLALILILDD